jgi:hypothetical protein
LAIACSLNLDEYIDRKGEHIDRKGKYMLELNAPPLGWSRDTTAEALDVGEEDELETYCIINTHSLASYK